MTVTINGTTGIAGVDGSAATPAVQGADTNTGVFYGTDIVAISTGGTERMRVTSTGVNLNGSTSGTLTIAAPAVAGTNTLTLPASTGTVALTSNVIGVDQTWQDVSASRVAGTTYTNNTGKPIGVFIHISNTTTRQLLVNGVTVGYYASGSSPSGQSTIVPAGGTYSISGSVTAINVWAELR